jgi:heme/copper-type cytochrome/quinol oxidase subunit 3
MLNDIALFLFGVILLFVLVKNWRGRSWKGDMTRLDEQRMRARAYYWPSVGLVWMLIALTVAFTAFEAARIALALWR